VRNDEFLFIIDFKYTNHPEILVAYVKVINNGIIQDPASDAADVDRQPIYIPCASVTIRVDNANAITKTVTIHVAPYIAFAMVLKASTILPIGGTTNAIPFTVFKAPLDTRHVPFAIIITITVISPVYYCLNCLGNNVTFHVAPYIASAMFPKASAIIPICGTTSTIPTMVIVAPLDALATIKATTVIGISRQSVAPHVALSKAFAMVLKASAIFPTGGTTSAIPPTVFIAQLDTRLFPNAIVIAITILPINAINIVIMRVNTSAVFTTNTYAIKRNFENRH